jgi:signal transduction histidine kinase
VAKVYVLNQRLARSLRNSAAVVAVEWNRPENIAATMDLEKIRQRSWLSWAGVALLVALCAVLAALQYRWIGEISSAESLRLREDLQSRLNLLHRDLNERVASACYGYIPSAAELQKLGRDAAYLERLRQSKDAGDRMVQRIALAVPDNQDLILLVPDRTRTRMLRQPWPANWADMETSLLTRLRGGPMPMAQSSTLLEFPRFASSADSGERRQTEQEWLLVDLDADYIGHTVVPELVTRYLGQPGKVDYDAEIVANGNSSVFIYRSPADSVDKIPWVADATIGLLDIDRVPFRSNDASGQPPQARELQAGPPNPPPAPGANRGLWILRVHHRAGSLEAIVTKARHRNILLSAGLLLLILATVISLVRFSRRAQRIAELQMNFVAGVSHELRTPLTVIRTAAFNLRGDLANQPRQVVRYGTLIREEAEKLSALVEQVLRYGNARAGRVLQKREPVAIPELIEAGLRAARAGAAEKEVVIEKRIEPNLPLVLGDRESLQHAFQNLFDNALKYGTQGAEWIGVSAASSKNGDGRAVEIRIADHGPGIPAEERDNIFDPFFRGQRPLQDQVHGTGLGLNLVKQIIEAHGGTITLNNGEERGAEFILRIPSAASEAGGELKTAQGSEGSR